MKVRGRAKVGVNNHRRAESSEPTIGVAGAAGFFGCDGADRAKQWPEVAKIASEGSGRWIVAKVNTEELPGLAQRVRINAIPLMAVFKGHKLARKAGCDAGLGDSAIC